jgi:hypothetical protein
VYVPEPPSAAAATPTKTNASARAPTSLTFSI